jgi:curved DNA-binding protein CbpA
LATHYDSLGVPRDASRSALRKAYERKLGALSRRPAAERVVEEKILKSAFDTLSDPAKRVDYDSRLEPTDIQPTSATSAVPLIVGLVVVAVTAGGIGYFLMERSKDQAYMRMEEKRAADREKAKGKPGMTAPAKQ